MAILIIIIIIIIIRIITFGHLICKAHDNEYYKVHVQGESNKVAPPTTFNDIFAWAVSFYIKFCTFIGNLHPHMCTDFRLFTITFNEMTLILSRAPIVFMVSSLDCSAGNKHAE